MIQTIDRQVLQFAVRNKPKVLWMFRCWYAILIGIALGMGILGFTRNPLFFSFYDIGPKAGELALLFFSLTITPGIVRRFRLPVPFMNLVMFFRRQFGVSTFWLVVLHYSIVRLIFMLTGAVPIIPTTVYEIVGLTGFLLLFPLFVTSNDTSVKKLGTKWKVLHKLVYIIVWVMFTHVALQSSTWMFVIGTMAVAETLSLLYATFVARNSITPSPAVSTTQQPIQGTP